MMSKLLCIRNQSHGEATSLERLLEQPAVVYCPICCQTGRTSVKSRRNTHQFLICALIGCATFIWCLPCIFTPKKGSTHYCSVGGVRLAYKPDGFAAITPSYVHDRDRLVATKGYSSHPKFGEDIELTQQSRKGLIDSPLGAPESSGNSGAKRTFHEIQLIPPPIKEGGEAEGKWRVESTDARFKSYGIIVDECPPWTDDTTDATPRYCDKVALWCGRHGPYDPEIQVERLSLEYRLRAKIRRTAASSGKGTKWNFDVSANGRNFDFHSCVVEEPSRETTEWQSLRGPLFWQTPRWYTNELLDAYGNICAVYRTAARQRGMPMTVSAADGLPIEVIDEMLLVGVCNQVQRAKRQEWVYATWKDDS